MRQTTLPFGPPPGQEGHPPPANIPEAIGTLLAVHSTGVDIPHSVLIDAFKALPSLDTVCRALPSDANSADKTYVVRVLASPTRDIPITVAIPPTVGALVAQVAKRLYDTTPLVASLSQIRPVIAPYQQALDTLRLPPSLLHAIDDTPPKGLNSALEQVRLTALSHLSREARAVITGTAPQPAHRLSSDGVRFPLADILAPMLAAALSGVVKGGRVSVLQARQAMFGDTATIEELELK